MGQRRRGGPPVSDAAERPASFERGGGTAADGDACLNVGEKSPRHVQSPRDVVMCNRLATSLAPGLVTTGRHWLINPPFITEQKKKARENYHTKPVGPHAGGPTGHTPTREDQVKLPGDSGERSRSIASRNALAGYSLPLLPPPPSPSAFSFSFFLLAAAGSGG